jgi:protein-S-isoprenylcysteine O-methyltransferase Ste14
MRNPIRLKNLNLRFAPYYVAGALLLVYSDIEWRWLALGTAPIGLGLGLRSWGAGHLVKNDRLAATGPYAYLRHPLYLGTLLVATGVALAFGGWTTLVVLAIVLPWFFLHYFPRKERIEAARLEARYGACYAEYRRQVPALWPRWPGWRPDPDAVAVGAGGSLVPVRWSAACWDDNNEHGTLLFVLIGLGLLALRASLG